MRFGSEPQPRPTYSHVILITRTKILRRISRPAAQPLFTSSQAQPAGVGQPHSPNNFQPGSGGRPTTVVQFASRGRIILISSLRNALHLPTASNCLPTAQPRWKTSGSQPDPSIFQPRGGRGGVCDSRPLRPVGRPSSLIKPAIVGSGWKVIGRRLEGGAWGHPLSVPRASDERCRDGGPVFSMRTLPASMSRCIARSNSALVMPLASSQCANLAGAYVGPLLWLTF